jgi:chemotaxis protein MotB
MDKSSEVFDEAGEAARKVPREWEKQYNVKPEEFKQTLKTDIENKLSDIKDQVLVDVFEGGVRIQLVDKDGKNMFDLGSAEPTPLALRIIRVIGDNIKSIPNPVEIEGHTDSLAYQSLHYSNWDLSTERALGARQALENNGLSPNRLTRIAGYADTVPFIQEDPRDPRNRRISIILKFPGQGPRLHAIQEVSPHEDFGQHIK